MAEFTSVGIPGSTPIFTVTSPDVPVVRLTVSTALSTCPVEIVTVVAPVARLPLETTTGSTISNGAPVETTALNAPVPTASRDTGNSNGSTALPCNERVVSSVNPAKILGGKVDNLLLSRWSTVSFVRLSKIPDGKVDN